MLRVALTTVIGLSDLNDHGLKEDDIDWGETFAGEPGLANSGAYEP